MATMPDTVTYMMDRIEPSLAVRVRWACGKALGPGRCLVGGCSMSRRRFALACLGEGRAHGGGVGRWLKETDGVGSGDGSCQGLIVRRYGVDLHQETE